MNEFTELANLVIARRASQEHDNKCNQGFRCPSRDRHIDNDYIARIRRQVMTEVRLAADELDRA